MNVFNSSLCGILYTIIHSNIVSLWVSECFLVLNFSWPFICSLLSVSVFSIIPQLTLTLSSNGPHLLPLTAHCRELESLRQTDSATFMRTNEWGEIWWNWLPDIKQSHIDLLRWCRLLPELPEKCPIFASTFVISPTDAGILSFCCK